MKLKIKTILLMIAFLILAAAIVYGLMAWVEMEAAKADDYFYVRTGYVSEPVLEIATPVLEVGR